MALLHHGRALDLATRESGLAPPCAMVEVGFGNDNCGCRSAAVTRWPWALVWSRHLARNTGDNPLVGGIVVAGDLRSARGATNLQTPLAASGPHVGRVIYRAPALPRFLQLGKIVRGTELVSQIGLQPSWNVREPL